MTIHSRFIKCLNQRCICLRETHFVFHNGKKGYISHFILKKVQLCICWLCLRFLFVELFKTCLWQRILVCIGQKCPHKHILRCGRQKGSTSMHKNNELDPFCPSQQQRK